MVTEAVRRELETLGETESALGAAALAVARLLDDAGAAASAVPAASRELRETLAVLRGRADDRPRADAVDELRQRRQARRAAAV